MSARFFESQRRIERNRQMYADMIEAGIHGKISYTPPVYAGPEVRWRDAILAELQARDGDACYLCREPLEPRNTHIDHIIPRSLGGEDRLYNLALACGPCNSEKTSSIVVFVVSSGRPCYIRVV